MDIKRTDPRGFCRLDFTDRYGTECSLQESSLVTESAIWFGVTDPHPMVCILGDGWKPVPLPEGAQCFGRMHLTQDQVRELLPLLQHFVETGRLR